MPNVSRVTAVWQGFQGAPGYSRFSFSEITTLTDANTAGSMIAAFFGGVEGYLHTSMSVTVQALVETFDVATSRLVAEITMSSPPAPVVGTAAGTLVYTGGAGAVVNWKTGVIFDGRRVTGRTFLVPQVGSSEADGTLNTSYIAAVNAAATILIAGTSPSFGVWAKSYDGLTPPTQTGGLLADVVAFTIPDKTGILKSRRD